MLPIPAAWLRVIPSCFLRFRHRILEHSFFVAFIIHTLLLLTFHATSISPAITPFILADRSRPVFSAREGAQVSVGRKFPEVRVTLLVLVCDDGVEGKGVAAGAVGKVEGVCGPVGGGRFPVGVD